jgi:hypothetical protein
MNSLVNRRSALRAALARDHPHGVTAFETGRAATTRNLRALAIALTKHSERGYSRAWW